MIENYKEIMSRIAAWWHGENERPCIGFVQRRNVGVMDDTAGAIDYWHSTDMEPDWEGFINKRLSDCEKFLTSGDKVPFISHSYGDRGTPMTMAFYLGGKVNFSPETAWVEPVIERWEDFEIKYDPNNYWWQQSQILLKKSVEKARDKYFVGLPDFGDALTVLSLLRGTEKLLFDLIDNKDAVLAARDKFVELWPQYHQICWDIYRQYYPGDNSWLTWAPGKTYACQCDFSTMISPELFKELVVPEIEAMGNYLDYIVWHLDGPEEIKHLDTLLDLPQIKAIQWVPGARHPTAAHWLPLLKRIQKKRKSIVVYPANEEEGKILIRELSPRGLLLIYR